MDVGAFVVNGHSTVVVASNLADLSGVVPGQIVADFQPQSRQANRHFSMTIKGRISAESLDNPAQPDHCSSGLG